MPENKLYDRLNMFSSRIKLFLPTIMLCCLTASGQYSVGHAGMTLRDEARGNRKVKFEAFYPVASFGMNDSASGMIDCKFPVICFAHGYQHPGNQYGNLVEILVPAGYIMLNLTTFEGPLPSHRDYADELRFLAAAAARLGRVPGSIVS